VVGSGVGVGSSGIGIGISGRLLQASVAAAVVQWVRAGQCHFVDPPPPTEPTKQPTNPDTPHHPTHLTHTNPTSPRYPRPQWRRQSSSKPSSATKSASAARPSSSPQPPLPPPPPPATAQSPTGEIVEIDDWLIDFANLFKEASGLDSERHVGALSDGWDASTRAMEAVLRSDAAAPLFEAAAEKFKEVTCSGLLNWCALPALVFCWARVCWLGCVGSLVWVGAGGWGPEGGLRCHHCADEGVVVQHSGLAILHPIQFSTSPRPTPTAATTTTTITTEQGQRERVHRPQAAG